MTTVPAKPGDVIILWGTGFGPTTPAAPVGVQVPGDQLYKIDGVTVTIDNAPAQVFGTALSLVLPGCIKSRFKSRAPPAMAISR